MRRWLPRLAITLTVLAVLGLALDLALDPIATWRTRRALAGMEGMRGRFTDVEIRLRDLSYVIHGLRIEKVSSAGAALPFFEVRRAEFGLDARQLLHRRIVARIELDGPRLNLVEAGGEAAKAPHGAGQEPQETPGLARQLNKLTPFLLDRVQIREGEILFVDAREPQKPTLRLREIEATLENFASRPALSKGEPTVLAARGILQRTGKVQLFATADPLAKVLTFAGQGRLEGLQLEDLRDYLATKADVTTQKGTLDMSIRFRAQNGALTGGIRPILRDAETRASHPGLWAKLKSKLADAALDIFKDDVPGRNAVATTIPITGSVKNPDAQALPTILGIVRNAFVRGLADSLEGLPPPKAKEPQGALEQARRALSRRAGQPRAQPSEEAQGGKR